MTIWPLGDSTAGSAPRSAPPYTIPFPLIQRPIATVKPDENHAAESDTPAEQADADHRIDCAVEEENGRRPEG